MPGLSRYFNKKFFVLVNYSSEDGTHPAHRGWQEGHPRGREGQAKHADGEAVPEDRHAGEVFAAEDREEGMNGRHAKSRLTGEELLQKRTTLYKV